MSCFKLIAQQIDNNQTSNQTNSTSLNQQEIKEKLILQKNTPIQIMLIVFNIVFFFIEIFQLVIFDNITKYLFNIKNSLEFFNYSLCLGALVFPNQITISIINIFNLLILILNMEKLPYLGIYVIAFRRSFK